MVGSEYAFQLLCKKGFPLIHVNNRGKRFKIRESCFRQIWYALSVGTSKACAKKIVSLVQIHKARYQDRIHSLVNKVFNVAVGGLYREACFRQDGFQSGIYDMPVCFRRYLYLKPQFPEECCPEGKKIVEIEDVWYPDFSS